MRSNSLNSSFFTASSTWSRLMVIFPSLVLTAPCWVPVSTATSCLWETRLAETHSFSNRGDSTSLSVMLLRL